MEPAETIRAFVQRETLLAEQRAHRRKERGLREIAALRQAAPQIPGLVRLILFGSFCTGDITEHSDVDLLLEAESGEALWRAIPVVESFFTVPVHVQPRGLTAPSFWEHVMRTGEVLYARQRQAVGGIGSGS